MNNELELEELRKGLLNQGIVISVLVDAMINKGLMTREEFETGIDETSKVVSNTIEELKQSISSALNEEFGYDEDIEEESGIKKWLSQGEGGDA